MPIIKKKQDSEVIVLYPNRRFGDGGTLADILYPYLERELLNRLSGKSVTDSMEYNGDTHKVVPCQGGVA